MAHTKIWAHVVVAQADEIAAQADPGGDLVAEWPAISAAAGLTSNTAWRCDELTGT